MWQSCVLSACLADVPGSAEVEPRLRCQVLASRRKWPEQDVLEQLAKQKAQYLVTREKLDFMYEEARAIILQAYAK